MIERIINNERLLAIIIRASYKKAGITFFTPEDLSQQLAYMNHPVGTKIKPHKHNTLPRKVIYTQEVLFVKKGRLRVDFYDTENKYIESCILEKGDIILLTSGGHGFEVLEEIEMIEVKQGPYAGDHDKVHFESVANDAVIIRGQND